jgi:hypothetical protein
LDAAACTGNYAALLVQDALRRLTILTFVEVTLALTHGQDGLVCECPSQTSEDFDLIEAVIGLLEWCYNSDALLPDIATPSEENFF